MCCGFDWGHGVWITLTGLVWYFTPGAKNEVGVHLKPQDFSEDGDSPRKPGALTMGKSDGYRAQKGNYLFQTGESEEANLELRE